jgi:hypothetical protein
MAASDENQTDFNPQRKLCPDGGCIGIIGSDGKCTECGRPDPGGDAPAAPSSWEDQDDTAGGDPGEESGGESGEGPSGFDSKRRLCSDDTCIGVIGPDNRCTECGKLAE